MPGVTTAYQAGVHGSRPAASAGCILYACSTHSLIYRSDGTTWTTWMTIGTSTTSVATDTIWDAAGDLVQGTGADTAAKLSAGLTGKVLQAAGAAAAVGWKYPPGYEFDYAEFTAAVNITNTSEGAADTIVTANAVTYDGSTVVMVEAYWPYFTAPIGADVVVILYDGASIGKLSLGNSPDAANFLRPNDFYAHRRLTPSAAAHTYSIRAYTSTGTAVAGAGAGGSGNYMPGFIRQTKVSGGA